MGQHYRQGDILIRQCEAVKGNLICSTNGRVVLAYGEATGHAHTIDATLAELFEEKEDGTLYLRVTAETAAVEHQEHTPITLERGTYQVVRQREYSPVEWRNVSD